MIQDIINNQSIIIVLDSDDKSFAAFAKDNVNDEILLQYDTLFINHQPYDLYGRPLNLTAPTLKKVNAYQEFWHSWLTFHPKTEKY